MTHFSARTQRWLALIGALMVAGILAIPLREMIYDAVVIPAAFILWNLDLLYRSFSQGIWWAAITVIVFLMIAFSLAPQPKFRRRVEDKRRPQPGQVENLALSLRKAGDGIYSKWLIANRLGKLAYQILSHRESGRPRSVFAPLVGQGWAPKQELQNYLETGLHGSFADFPNVRRPFGVPKKTPLDLDIAEVVEFLESQVESGKPGS